jgi:GNAT superfamily N-acetyltransferase
MANKVSITPITKEKVPDIELLRDEFEEYLQSLSNKPRETHSARERKARLLKDGFGKNRAFYGFVAKRDGKALGYVFYHFGYDPDEMQGRVVYVIDLFVTQDSRGLGIGRRLMRKVASLCKERGGKAVYFGVWRKNKRAIRFYKSLGAHWINDVPFMCWDIKDRNKG